MFGASAPLSPLIEIAWYRIPVMLRSAMVTFCPWTMNPSLGTP